MKASLLVQALLSLCFCWPSCSGSDDQHKQLELTNLIPRRGEVEGWLPEGDPQFAAGEDLFLLINGGAAIYHEYGFKEAIFQSYGTKDGNSINLEIYEMAGQKAAYGMYTFKTRNDGEPIALGQEGWLESYYLNFWKGNFLVTVIGLDTAPKTLAGIKKIAQAVEAKLQSVSQRPGITSYLPKENLQVNGITYLKGNLALFNQYRFDDKDIFGLQEGVIGKYDDYSLFIFQYQSQEEAEKWYESAKNHLKQSGQFTNFLDRPARFEIRDPRNDRLVVKQYQYWIITILGNDHTNANKILSSLETGLIKKEE